MGFFGDTWNSVRGGIGKVAGYIKGLAGKVAGGIRRAKEVAGKISRIPVIGRLAKDLWEEVPFHNEISDIGNIAEGVSDQIGKVAGQVQDVSGLKMNDALSSLPALKDSVMSKVNKARLGVMAPYRV